MNCRLVLSLRSQFFHSLLFLSVRQSFPRRSIASESATKVCNWLRSEICTVAPSLSCTLTRCVSRCHAFACSRIDLVALDPPQQRLRRTADLRRDRLHGRPQRQVLSPPGAHASCALLAHGPQVRTCSTCSWLHQELMHPQHRGGSQVLRLRHIQERTANGNSRPGMPVRQPASSYSLRLPTGPLNLRQEGKPEAKNDSGLRMEAATRWIARQKMDQWRISYALHLGAASQRRFFSGCLRALRELSRIWSELASNML